MSLTKPVLWDIEADRTCRRRPCWAIWKPNNQVYGGREYLLTKSFSRKRFYDENKAIAAADKLNRRAALSASAEKACAVKALSSAT